LLGIYQRERGKLLGVARRRLGSFSQDAEDVVQEVMRKLCERPVALRDPDKPPQRPHAPARRPGVVEAARRGVALLGTFLAPAWQERGGCRRESSGRC
jgi:hypothetical protein